MIVERKKGQWSESASRVLRERYLWRKEGTVLEDEDGMCWRVARAVAEAEREWGADDATVNRTAESFYQVMIDRQFMPNSPTLMNAGKNNGQQLSACFVLPVGDSLPEIFDAIKHAAIIHKSGGGCIAGDAHIFTTFCGVETIATLYERVRATGKQEELRDGHAVMDVRDLGIRTMALDPEQGTYKPAPVTHLWRYDVPLADQLRIRCADGLEVTTSVWHPFMVFDGRRFVERRADELKPGDILSTPNASVRDQWPHTAYREVAGIVLDEEIAWLLGYYLGDGSLGWAKVPKSEPRREKLRWRVFDGRTASLERVRAILATRFNVRVQVQQDARGLYSLTSTDVAFIARFRDLLDVNPGPKEDLPFPEMVAKSPLSVVGAFLAGLVDSDGYADGARHRVSFTTTSEGLARKVHTLCALLGLAPGIRARAPYGKGRTMCYEVRLAAEPRIADLQAVIGAHMTDELKAGRPAAMLQEHTHVTAPRLPIPFAAVEDMLQSLGIATATTAIHRHPVRVGGGQFWLHNWKQGQGVSAETLLPLIAALRPLVDDRYHIRLDLLERLLHGAAVVQAIERPERQTPFYDFTVEGFSTYLAGTNGLTAIHNTGFGLSRLRSEGSEVATTRGVASGPVSFLRVFNAATEAVKQGGTRRGANMGVLRVDHPDVLKFIDCKRPDPATGVRDITNFNISVAATDAFMDALERGADYELRDPHTQKVTGTLNAREVFDKICAAAWATGDPGLLFIDRANNSPSNPIQDLEQIEATNTCVIGATWLATSAGPKRVGALHATGEAITVVTDARAAGYAESVAVHGGTAPEITGVEQHAAVPVFQTGTQVPVWRLVTSHGIEITATPNHRFLTPDGYKRLDRLQYGDTLLLQSAEGAWSSDPSLPAMPPFGLRGATRQAAWEKAGRIAPPKAWSAELGEVLGYAIGDGYLRHDGEMYVLGLAISEHDADLAELLQARLVNWFGYRGNRARRQGHIQLQYTGLVADFFAGLGLSSARAAEKRVPESVFAAPREAVVGFLRGLFSADGSVQSSEAKGACSVRLAASSKGLAQDVQQLLLNFGIVSAIRLRRQAGFTLLPDAMRNAASYPTQAQYEVILDKANRDRFATEIGFMQEQKQRHLCDWIAAKKRTSNRETFTTQVAVIEDAGLADVFDTTEPVTHSIIANGLVTHQCGEQWLGGYDACNLGSINLAECVIKQDGAYAVDWTELERVTRVTTRFLDDVIEINPLPLEQIRETVRANRRIGLGIMGWADLLFLLGVAYDTDEALALGEKVMSFVNQIAHDESQQLARARSPFPNFAQSIYRDGPPLRNATLTTVAPTGSISIIADCSSGIEPVFALAFMHVVDRGKPTERKLVLTNPIFERIAREQGFYSEQLMEKVSEHGSVADLPEVPEHWRRVFVNAHEVSPEWHIKMQAAFQHGVDNSISKTINVPNSASVQDIADAYLLAWAEGCKGITVFRDGCLATGQVLNVGTKDAQAPAASVPAPAASAPAPAEVTAPPLPAHVKPRPPIVFGYTRQVKAPEGTANITINTDESGPLEVFLSVGRAGSDIAALAEALGRLISLCLRLPSPITAEERLRLIATQLRGIGGSRSIGFGAERVLSLPDALAQAFMSHLEQGLSAVPRPITKPLNGNGNHGPTQLTLPTVTVLGNLCPQCGSSAAFVLEEGCKKCHGCGYSEC